MTGMRSVFAIIGGSVASNGRLRSRYVPIAPSKVASVPNSISNIPNGEKKKFVKKHPTDRPTMASGNIIGSSASISEMRNCIGPNAIALNAVDRAKYNAAITADLAIKSRDFFKIHLGFFY